MIRSSGLAKRSYKAPYQGKENEEGKRKDGKTTSESGPVSTSTAVREQPKTSEMAEDCRRCQLWCPYDPMVPGRGTQVTGNRQNYVTKGKCSLR